MKIISKLELWNFQPYKHQVINLAHPITTLVGPNDSGKSTVLRALIWICTNQGVSKEIMRTGAKYVKGRLTAGKHIITRVTGSHKNQYILNGKKLKAVGHKVPREIAAILNINLDNFQQQLDPPFWFAATPSQIGAQLNKIVNLDLIDRATARIASKVRETNTHLNIARERLQEAKLQRSKLQVVPELLAQFAAIQKLQSKLEGIKSNELSQLIKHVKSLRRQLNRRPKKEPDFDAVKKLLHKQESIKDKVTRLTYYLNRLQQLKDQQWHRKKELSKLGKEMKKTADRCPTCGQLLTS